MKNSGKANSELEFGYFGSKRQLHEVQFCARAIANYFDCRCFSRTLPNGVRAITFFGFAQDVAAAMALSHALMIAMEQDYGLWSNTQSANQVHGKTLRSAFMRGFGERVSERLDEMKVAQKAVVSTGTALVVLKGQLITQAMADHGVKLKKQARYATRNDGAKEAGRAAGDRASLVSGKGVSETKKLGDGK